MSEWSRGSQSELIAAADLIGLGYEVYGALDSTSSADLIIRSAGGEILFVEVKTSWRGRFTQESNLANKKADILALVHLDLRAVQYRGMNDKLWGDTPLALHSTKILPWDK